MGDASGQPANRFQSPRLFELAFPLQKFAASLLDLPFQRVVHFDEPAATILEIAVGALKRGVQARELYRRAFREFAGDQKVLLVTTTVRGVKNRHPVKERSSG